MGRSIGRIAGIVIFSLGGGAMPFTLAGQVKQPPPVGTIGAEQAVSAARGLVGCPEEAGHGGACGENTISLHLPEHEPH